MMHLKRQQLEQGLFDERDQAKMPDIVLDHPEINRLKLAESLEMYMEMTSGSKKPTSIINDRNTLENLFDHFRESAKTIWMKSRHSTFSD